MILIEVSWMKPKACTAMIHHRILFLKKACFLRKMVPITLKTRNFHRSYGVNKNKSHDSEASYEK